jgi:putative toxin-antitoxin system antitoxin component (TIGR02293 family)
MPSTPDQPKDSNPPHPGVPAPSLEEVLTRLNSELSVKELWKIASRIGMSAEQFEKLTDISPHRVRRGRGGDERVDLTKNASFIRCVRVFKRVVALCNKDEGAARKWLTAEAPMLKNQKPIEAAETAAGAKSVEAIVAQLEKAAGLA